MEVLHNKWKYYLNTTFNAYTAKLRHLKIEFNKDNFIDEYMFCSKYDLYSFLNFFEEFIENPLTAEVEYIFSEKRKPFGDSSYKLISIFRQPNTTRIVYQEEHEMDVKLKTSLLDILPLEIKSEVRKNIKNSFNDLEKIELKKLFETIKIETQKQDNWV